MQTPITITDNSQRHLTESELVHLDNLKSIAGQPIASLSLDDHPNLLVFPQSLNEYGDKIGDSHILQMDGQKIITGNIMGFVGYHDTNVEIKSRFAQDDDRDFFLHYMLQRVFAINLFDLKYHADEESVFDFLIYLFPTFLKRAMRQGLYKEYQTRRYNDTNVKGRIDVSRHIRQNIPFAGKVAYSTREYTYDNHVTQLIRHTIEYIARHPFCGGILRNDEYTKDAVCQIKEATPTYNRNETRRIISQNLRPLSHPYFYEYRNLQRLCLQILRHEELKYGHDEQDIYGILFDGAWLWEEYLNTFLHPILQHPRNKTKEGRLWLFKGNSGECYPDFYSKELGIVLDAKYKGYDSWANVQNADLYQVIAYMHITDAQGGGFIVPTKQILLPTKILNGAGARQMGIFGMAVNHEADNFPEYCQYMKALECELIERIKLFNHQKRFTCNRGVTPGLVSVN